MHHRRGLRRLLQDDALLERIEADWRSAGLSSERVAMLGYVEKLSACPPQVEPTDCAALRAAGFGDADILAIAEVAAYYAYANRIADGLGVRLEQE